ncbi:cation:proton antiporter [Candidatus Woesearchaeota archaeon]|nr:cation:proton antiporter [Candidatus Woesearchaeota archaeon]
MASASLIFLSYLAAVLLLGILCSIIARRLKIPNVLLLLLVGIILNNVTFEGKPLVYFPTDFITSISLLALVVIVFDSASRFKLKELDELSIQAFKLTMIFLLLNLVILTIATDFIFRPESILLSVLFASLMSGTAPSAIVTMFKEGKSKVADLLEIESIVNTPIMVLIPFIIIDLMRTLEGKFTVNLFIEQIRPFFLQIVSGIGAGVLVGLLFFKVMRKQYEERISPLALIAAGLLTYIAAEHLGGNGVLAVTVAGILFGTFYIKQKEHLLEFSLIFSNFLEILVFVFVGLLIEIPFNAIFFLKSFALFAIFILLRFISIELSFIRKEYKLREKVFMALNAPKGIAVAVVAATFLSYTVPGSEKYILGMSPILDLTLIFLLYSILLSTIVVKFANKFLHKEVLK